MRWEDSNLFTEEPKYPHSITWRHRDKGEVQGEVQCARHMALWHAPGSMGCHVEHDDDDSGDEGVNYSDHDDPIDFEEPDEDVHLNLMVCFFLVIILVILSGSMMRRSKLNIVVLCI